MTTLVLDIKPINDETAKMETINNIEMYKLECCRLTCLHSKTLSDSLIHVHQAANNFVLNPYCIFTNNQLLISEYKPADKIIGYPVLFALYPHMNDIKHMLYSLKKLQTEMPEISLLVLPSFSYENTKKQLQSVFDQLKVVEKDFVVADDTSIYLCIYKIKKVIAEID